MDNPPLDYSSLPPPPRPPSRIRQWITWTLLVVVFGWVFLIFYFDFYIYTK
jgi:hypothetical protein